MRFLNADEILHSVRDPNEDQNYYKGRAEIVEVLRGRKVSSKELILKIEQSKFLINVPDLPWPPSSQLEVGAIISGLFEVSQVPIAVNPTSFEGYLSRKGIGFKGRAIVLEVISQSKNRNSVDKFISDLNSNFFVSYGLDLIVASILGREEVLAKEQTELFKRTSTTHLIVVSGFHVGVLSRVAEKGVLEVLKLYPKVFLFIAGELIAAIFGLGIAIFYGFIIGFSLTVTRALVALAIVTCGRIILKRADSLSALGLALVIVQLIWPGSIFEPGCQLTFAALLGLIVASKVLTNLENINLPSSSLEAQLRGADWRVKHFLFSYTFSPVLTCFIVGLTVSPITLIWFQQFVPLSPIINAILIPIFTAFVLILGGVALFIYKLLHITYLLNLAVFFSSQVINLIEYLEFLTIKFGLGPVQVSHLGAVSLCLVHLALLGIFLNFLRFQRLQY